MDGWNEVPEADGNSHAELTAGAGTLEKLQTLPVREAASLTTGRETVSYTHLRAHETS